MTRPYEAHRRPKKTKARAELAHGPGSKNVGNAFINPVPPQIASAPRDLDKRDAHMNSSDTTRPGRKPTEPAARLPHRARDGRPATLKITCTVTHDSPDGRPWPPTEGDVLWRLLRRADECSYWRAIEIRSAATDFIPRQQSQLKGSEHEER